ncbi:MAG TPA: hypothetical protein VI168_00220 [Croceibacterium sp.]
MTRYARLLPAFVPLSLAACQPVAESGGAAAETAPATVPDAAATQTYDGIRPDETLRFTGTEPFWGGEVTGASLTYTTPEDQDGTAIAVERFAGRGGLSFSGRLADAGFEMTVTPLGCSDGMSDRTYPFTVTLKIGDDLRNGCGWSEREPFQGPAQP